MGPRTACVALSALILCGCPPEPKPNDSDGGAGGQGTGGGGGGGGGVGGGTGGGGGGSGGGGTGGGTGGGGVWDAGVYTFDVVVVGAGTGGVAAAVQAGRMGMRVALLDETDWVGGQATTAGVSSMDVSGALEADYGLYGELIAGVRARYQAAGKSIGTCYWSANSQCFEPHVGQQLLRAMLADAGTKLFPKVEVVRVERAANQVTGVVADGGAVFRSQVVVDATEAGDLLPLAGARYRVGNSTSDAIDLQSCIQDITYTAIIRKYPAGVPPELVTVEPPGYAGEAPYFARIVARDGGAWFDGVSYPFNFVTHNAYRGTPDSKGPGSYHAGDPAAAAFITKTGVNYANDYPAVATYNPPPPPFVQPTLSVRYLEDRAYRRQVDCEARLRTLNFIHHVQTALGESTWSIADDEGYSAPPCANVPQALKAVESHFPLYPYIRESRRMVGLHTLTAAELMPPDAGGGISGTLFPDAIGVGGYGNDLHNCSQEATLEGTLEHRSQFSSGRVFQIPFASFIPTQLDGFLPAEKNFSQTRLVNGATRLQPTTMMTGQAVGALAALAVRRGVQPRAVSPALVQDVLVKAGARISLYRFGDVAPGDPLWRSVELVSARGLMVGNGVDFLRNDVLTRAQAATVFSRLLQLPTANPPSSPSFQDVGPSLPEYAAIEAVKAAGLTTGCSTSPPLYCPSDSLTRAQLAVFLARGLHLDLSNPGSALFADVPSSHPLFAYVQAAAKAGLVNGCTASAYCPDSATDRGRAATALHAAVLYGK